MPTNICQRTAMAAAIAACFPGAAFAAGVARVDFASGNVAAIAPDGRSRALSKGAEINVGETVSTQQGRAQLRFADGAYMSLQPQTEFKVEEFKYSGKNEPSDGIVMNLLKGGLRTITGLIGRTNRNAYRLKTEVATIGIRGTEYSVRYTNSIEVFVADGAVSVQNDSGTFVVPGGTGVMVSNQNTPPQQTDQKPVLPPESPAQQEQEEQTQQPADPVNPIQDAFPPVSQTILTGSVTANWAISYAYDGVTSSSGTAQSVVLDGSGALTSFSFTDTFEGFTSTTTLGTAQASSTGNDGIIAWGRWSGGVTDGDLISNANLAVPFEGPLHYIVGLPATNLPASGEATYGMIGSDSSSAEGPVKVVSSSLNVNFAMSSATFHAHIDVNGNAFITSPSGVSVSRTGAHMSTGSGSFGTFPGACSPTLTLRGFLAGDGASRAGMAYQFFHNDSVNGVIAYTKK